MKSKIKFVLFCIAVWTLLFFGMTTDLSAGNKADNRKQHREYAKRADSCRKEQYRIQSSGVKHKVWKNKKSKLSK